MGNHLSNNMTDTSASYLDRAIADPDRHFETWHMSEIWTGPTGTGNYVPNPDDMIIDWNTGIYRCAGVDYSTGLSDLRPWSWRPSTETDDDVMEASGPGAASEAWRIYLDTRKFPYTVSVDAALHIYGDENTYYKLFRGTEISEARGEVISGLYDQNNEHQGDNIPLVLVATNRLDNRAIKAPSPCYTTTEMDDGDVISIVAYNRHGTMTYRRRLVVENTSLTKRGDDSMKYVKAISLKSDWLSPTENNVLEIPINVDMRTVILTGVVEYSNGEKTEYPLSLDGGTRFSVFGLSGFVPTIEGQSSPMQLDYVLQDNEYSTVMAVTETGSVTQPYRIRTKAVDKAYSVKLYAYPVWNIATSAYDLEFWLYNLDRRDFHRLPRGVVELYDDSRPFDGQDFLSNQRVAFSVLLSAVDARYSNHRHIQTMEISLRTAGTIRGTNWMVHYEPGVGEPYGAQVEAAMTFVNSNQWYVDLKNGAGGWEPWLNMLYYPTKPLRDTRSEFAPPEPTHFVVHTKRRQYEFDKLQWDSMLPIVNDLGEGETLYIEWIKRTSTTDLRLGVTGLPVHVINQA